MNLAATKVTSLMYNKTNLIFLIQLVYTIRLTIRMLMEKVR